MDRGSPFDVLRSARPHPSAGAARLPPEPSASASLESAFVRAVGRRYAHRDPIGPPEGGGLYVVLEGRVKLSMEDAQGRQVTIGYLERGAMMSAAELTAAGGAALRASADKGCRLLHVSERQMEEALRFDRAAGPRIVQALTARLLAAHAITASLAFSDVRARVAETLLANAHSVDGARVADCGSEEIARRVAASREMVSRVMRRMADDGLIRRRRRSTAILDEEGLRRIGSAAAVRC